MLSSCLDAVLILNFDNGFEISRKEVITALRPAARSLTCTVLQDTHLRRVSAFPIIPSSLLDDSIEAPAPIMLFCI